MSIKTFEPMAINKGDQFQVFPSHITNATVTEVAIRLISNIVWKTLCCDGNFLMNCLMPSLMQS
mgnify:CR=1 FL=1|jgi:hypothetical protein